MDNLNDYISLADYAALHNVTPDTVRQKILRGNLQAVKVGRNYVIRKDTEYIDHRRKQYTDPDSSCILNAGAIFFMLFWWWKNGSNSNRVK